MKFTKKTVGIYLDSGDLADECLKHLEADPRWRLVEQIVSSARFGRAAQLRNFLLYVARRRLVNNAVEISEQEIGIDVFHRRANFNPNEDNIVRVQARQLRKRLEEYFADEGKEQTLVVTIPKGSYVPEFGPRIRTNPGKEPIESRDKARLVTPLLTLGLVLFAIVAALLWKRNIDLERQTHSATALPSRIDPLWARIFTNQQKTNVVLGDANLVLLEDFVRSDVTLEQYLNREYPENLLSTVDAEHARPILKLMSSWRNSWFGDFGLANVVMEQGRRYSGRAVLRFPNGLNVGELRRITS